MFESPSTLYSNLHNIVLFLFTFTVSAKLYKFYVIVFLLLDPDS